MRAKSLIVPVVLAMAMPAFAQLSPSATWATQVATQYRMTTNVTYRTASNTALKLDVYSRTGVTTPQPTLVYFHGGFWVAGNKEGATMALMPWLEMGWNVVNVEYRLGLANDATTLAPAAVSDCFCALRFLAASAAAYNIDVSKLVVTGESAGGHLALAMGTVPEEAATAGKECTGAAAPARGGGARGGAPATPPAAGAAAPQGAAGALPPLPKVAAVINWFGITDVPDVIDGANRRDPAARWFGLVQGQMPTAQMLEVAKKVSPLAYVKAGLPPIITVHGDADPTVPYPEAVKLHEELTKAKVPNQLISIPRGGHGGFTAEQRVSTYISIREFLTKNGVMSK